MKMKAITAVCNTGASVPAISNGRVHRSRPSGDGENAEIKMYLSKLKDLVPYMPKNRKLSKLEIIQNVIDYICDLQNELETHPTGLQSVSQFDANSALSELSDNEIILQQQQQQHQQQQSHSHQLLHHHHHHQQQQQHNNFNTIIPSQNTRQPLADRSSPNMILSSSYTEHHNYHLQAQQLQQQQQQQQQQIIALTQTTTDKSNIESR